MARYYDLQEYTERSKLQQELRANVEKDMKLQKAQENQSKGPEKGAVPVV